VTGADAYQEGNGMQKAFMKMRVHKICMMPLT